MLRNSRPSAVNWRGVAFDFALPPQSAGRVTSVSQRAVQASDFEVGSEGAEWPCRMRSDGRRRFVGALEAKLESPFVHPRLGIEVDYRRAMQAQVRHYLAVLVRVEPVYLPLKLR